MHRIPKNLPNVWNGAKLNWIFRGDLNKEAVRSSVARRLGVEIGALTPADRHVEGIVAMVLDATTRFDQPLTDGDLFGWHAALFPTGYSLLSRIRVGQWRDDTDGAMQVVSGAIGRQAVHYQAPPASCLPSEMHRFLDWLNAQTSEDLVLKAGLAHLWFITLHPFDDGNGRIARAIGDRVLAQSEQTSQRFYSLSAQIQRDRQQYYNLLERTQKGSMDVTDWLRWCIDCLDRAIMGAQITLGSVLDKAHFWEYHADQPFNTRQRKVLNKLLDGFEGKLTTRKYAAITHCSPDTALRDINDLISRSVLQKAESSGRSSAYLLGIC